MSRGAPFAKYSLKLSKARKRPDEVDEYFRYCDQDGCRWSVGPLLSKSKADTMWKFHMKSHGIDVK